MQDRLPERETFAKVLDRSQYARPLVLAPHPDDEVYGCGGLLALWAAAGVQPLVVLVTGGQAQGEATAEPNGLLEQRESESRRAAELLGYALECWHLDDRGLRCNERLIARIGRALEQHRPDVVLAPALTEPHPDHQALTLALSCAVARLGSAHPAPDLMLYESGGTLTQANVLVDISSVRELKARAMAAFESQETAQPYQSRISARDHFRALQLGPGVQAAEAYTRLPLRHAGWAAVVPALEPLLLHGRGQAVQDQDLPKVSVLVRTVGDAHLERTLASVAAQTYPRLEVVLVAADGRTPAPEGWAAQAGLELRYVNTASGLSRPAAANAALDAATGDWLIFLDDDDLWTPEHVAKLVACQTAQGQCRAVHTDVRVINDTGDELALYDQPWSAPRMAFTNVLPIHSVLFAADLVRREGCRFDEALPVLEDWDFWLQVTQHTDVRHAPGISALYRYRDRAGLQRDDHLHHHRQWREKVQARWLQRLGPEQVGRAATWYAQALDETRQQLQTASGLRAAQLLRDELDVVQGRLRDTQAELQMAAERLSTSAYELTSSQAQQKLLEGQVQDLRQFAELRARLSDELREQLTRAEIKLRDTQAELQQAGLDLADATTQGAAAREALVLNEQERAALTIRVDELLAVAEGAQAEALEAQQALKAERERLWGELERLQALTELLSGQLDQTRRSTSWRVTAPLRWLSAAGRRWLR